MRLVYPAGVIQAVILRELSARLVESKLGWLWLLLEPVAVVLVVVLSKDFLKGLQLNMAGADNTLWIILGFLGFFLFRDGMFRSMSAVESNRGMLLYPVIKPFDLIVGRAVADGLIRTLALVLLLLGFWFFDYQALPRSVFDFSLSWFGVWFLGLSVGIFISGLSALIGGVDKFVKIFSLPLLLFSGVFFPVHFLSPSSVEVALWNPVLHGIELLRLSFFDNYWSNQSISGWYLVSSSAFLFGFGLMLHSRYEYRLRGM